MKFWSGFDGHESQAAEACAAGGWIPASRQVVQQPAYQQALERWPLLAQFVELAASPNQKPVPAVPVASQYYQEVVEAAQEVMYRGDDPRAALTRAAENTRQRLREVLDEP
jgi:ABC-type glycerol-3-phosphate transport system substrate-binding protein